MAVKMEVKFKITQWGQPLETQWITPRLAFLMVRDLCRLKGFEYADVLPIIDGEALVGSRFKVERGDNVVEKFAGYHNVAA